MSFLLIRFLRALHFVLLDLYTIVSNLSIGRFVVFVSVRLIFRRSCVCTSVMSTVFDESTSELANTLHNCFSVTSDVLIGETYDAVRILPSTIECEWFEPR